MLYLPHRPGGALIVNRRMTRLNKDSGRSIRSSDTESAGATDRQAASMALWLKASLSTRYSKTADAPGG